MHVHDTNTHTAFTHSSQPPVMKLIGSCVVAGGDQLVAQTGDVAADAGHLGGGVDRTLLGLRLHLHSLTETNTKRLN